MCDQVMFGLKAEDSSESKEMNIKSQTVFQKHGLEERDGQDKLSDTDKQNRYSMYEYISSDKQKT